MLALYFELRICIDLELLGNLLSRKHIDSQPQINLSLSILSLDRADHLVNYLLSYLAQQLFVD